MDRRLIIALAVSFSITLLSACGGSSGGGTTAPSIPASALTGILSDAAIAGVRYTATPSGYSGITNASGHFRYEEGDTIRFDIAGMTIDHPATSRVTPATIVDVLFPTLNDSERNQAMVNLLILLQSLDADGNLTNGISVPATLNLPAALSNTNNLTDSSVFQAALDDAFANDPQFSDLQQVSPSGAIEHFYLNELRGSWQMVRIAEVGGSLTAEQSDERFLITFDRDGRFVFASYDVSLNVDDPTDDLDGDIALGETSLPGGDNTAVFTTGIGRSLYADLCEEEIDFRSFSVPCEQGPFGNELRLSGENLIMCFGECGDDLTQNSITFARLANIPGSLTGTWVEITSNPVDDDEVIVSNDKTLSYGSSISAITNYFLEDGKTLVSITHDLSPEGSDREKNGLTVAEYSTSEGVITIDRIIVDSVSKDPEDPVFSAGESFGYSFDSNAVLVFLELEDDEEIPTYRVLSEQERNSGLF
jgi:hypothetical protein